MQGEESDYPDLAMPEEKSLLMSIGFFSSPSALAIVIVARMEETAM